MVLRSGLVAPSTVQFAPSPPTAWFAHPTLQFVPPPPRVQFAPRPPTVQFAPPTVQFAPRPPTVQFAPLTVGGATKQGHSYFLGMSIIYLVNKMVPKIDRSVSF